MSIKNNDELIAQAICEYEKGIVKILLLCVDNLEFGLGINKLVQILKGGQTRFITDFSLQNNIDFSLLKQFSKKDIEYITQKASEKANLRRFCEYIFRFLRETRCQIAFTILKSYI